MNDNKGLFEALTHSRLYQDYEQSFSEATGLPVTFRPVDSWQLPHHGKRKENGFCALIAGKSRSCAACLQVQQQLSDSAVNDAASLTCPFGLCDTAVPVRTGNRLIGFLQTGQVFRKKPSEEQFERTARLAAEWGVPATREQLHDTYFGTLIVAGKHYESIVKLLSIFAQHLSVVTNQLIVQQENSELPVITRAKEYIKAHQKENISLSQVAKSVNTSTFYFCKLFKKAVGIHFTNYRSRLRIESAKNLLLNPNLRISEIAYEVGFQSLTNFNRVFRNITGESPTIYRSRLSRTN